MEGGRVAAGPEGWMWLSLQHTQQRGVAPETAEYWGEAWQSQYLIHNSEGNHHDSDKL